MPVSRHRRLSEMGRKRNAFMAAAALAAVTAGIGCNFENVEYHGAYADHGIGKYQVPPVTVMMINYALQAVTLPGGAVAPDTYVAVYRLSSGKGEEAWWTYLSEDWLIDKIRAAGATPVERNAAAASMLAEEENYLAVPKRGGDPTGGYVNPKLKENPEKRIPFRAERALAYRIVAADLSVARPDRSNLRRGALRTTATVILNLRTVDVRTGEVLWAGVVTGTATKDVPISWFDDGWPWPWWADDDWEDAGDDAWRPWLWRWEAGTPVQPADPVPGTAPPGNPDATAPSDDSAPDEDKDAAPVSINW